MKTLILYVALAVTVSAAGEVGRVLEPLKPGEIVARGWQKPPVKLVVPMLRVSAAYPAKDRREPGVGSKYKGTHTPLPSAGLVAPDPGATCKPVELVPFGATCLRTTCFPTAKD